MLQSTRGSTLRSDSPLPARLGNWRLVGLVGSGRWMQVYRAAPADCLRSAADYVLKTPRAACGEDPSVVSMLRREAFLGRHVRHPHLPAVLAVRLESAPRYLVMPFAEGATVRQALAYAGRIAAPHAYWIARQAAEALQALHGEGWRHGDVKPENLYVAANGHATLLDLGLARPLDLPANEDSPLAGTLPYAAPELFTTAAPGAPSDVYSLGITLFEMLSGRLPFVVADRVQLVRAHRELPCPDIRKLDPTMPRELASLLRCMLAKEPLRRPDLSDLIARLVELEIDSLPQRAAVLESA